MKRVLLTVIFLWVGLTVYAADKESEQKDRPDSRLTEELKSPRADQKSKKKKTQPNWPRPYSPTEEVRADSIVPFPTDI